jgi:hypothetical protein
MLKLLKPAVIAIQATLGVALSTSWSLPALADAAPANTATQNQTTPLLHTGDLVRLRSGGPAMTVKRRPLRSSPVAEDQARTDLLNSRRSRELDSRRTR